MKGTFRSVTILTPQKQMKARGAFVLQIFFLSSSFPATAAQHPFPQQRNDPPLPCQPPYFSEAQTRQVSFRHSAWLLPSAPECLCDLHYSEVSNPLSTSGNDKKKRHIITLKSPKKPSGLLQNNPGSISFLMNIDE